MNWVDKKGRAVEIFTMSDRWLNNIRKKFKGDKSKIQPIMDEIKRRKSKKKPTTMNTEIERWVMSCKNNLREQVILEQFYHYLQANPHLLNEGEKEQTYGEFMLSNPPIHRPSR